MNLSPHFTLAEMSRSQAAIRKGLNNVPPPAAIDALRGLCLNVLEPLRAHFGPVLVTSGYRSPSVNKAIGGSLSSQHCKGQAADFTVPGQSNLAVCQWIMRNLKYDQLIYEFGESGWVHCSWHAGPLRNEERTAQHREGRVKYPLGLIA